ncbi:MAG: iron-containing redox enzyme family protein [Armatimonadetes bacterium]|nr:iron-containing redox enzyme family protein [Armatimonadota bacterium]
MNLEQRLQDAIEPYRLLNHPFYQAWSEGTLPIEKLRVYAEEYGALVGLLPMGWTVQNDEETQHEEEEHIELWEEFAHGLDTHAGEGTIAQTKTLVETTRRLFGNRATALGALYAFEVQQPETASSKLDGLRQFYSLPTEVEPYFIEHSKNHHEAEKLIARLTQLSDEDQAIAIAACGEMAKALYDALTGIHGEAAA